MIYDDMKVNGAPHNPLGKTVLPYLMLTLQFQSSTEKRHVRVFLKKEIKINAVLETGNFFPSQILISHSRLQNTLAEHHKGVRRFLGFNAKAMQATQNPPLGLYSQT